MAEEDEYRQQQQQHHHPYRSMASANIKSASDGSISQLHVNVSDLDAIFDSAGVPPPTTTISTIAVQAGDAQIILAIHRVTFILRLITLSVSSFLFFLECGRCSCTHSTNGTSFNGYWFESR